MVGMHHAGDVVHVIPFQAAVRSAVCMVTLQDARHIQSTVYFDVVAPYQPPGSSMFVMFNVALLCMAADGTRVIAQRGLGGPFRVCHAWDACACRSFSGLPA